MITASFILVKVRQKIASTDGLRKDLAGVFFFKGLSMVINYIMVALILNVLTSAEYGIWLAISSVVTWLNFTDFGLANGLKNKLIKLFAQRKFMLAKVYVSSAIFLMSAAGIVVLLLLAVITWNIDFGNLLNAGVANRTLYWIVLFSVLFFVLKAVTDLIQSFKVAEQHVSYVTYISFIGNLILLMIVLSFAVSERRIGLLPFSFLFSFVPFAVSLFYAVTLIKHRYRQLLPSLKKVSFRLTKDVYQLSMRFFFIQLAAVIIFSTDNFIISVIFNPEEVTKYNICYRLFGLIPMLINVVLTPYWPAIGRAFHLGNFAEIKNKMTGLLLLWCGFAVLAIFIFFFAGPIYSLWLGKDMGIPVSMNLGMLIYSLIVSWNMVFATFINSIGKVKLQLYSSLLVGLLNIPAAILLANCIGPQGVIWATVLCLLPSAVWSPIQYYKLIAQKAKGIWNL